MIVGIRRALVIGAGVLIAAIGLGQTKAPPVSSAPVCPYFYRGDINSRYAFAEASEVALSYASMAVKNADLLELNPSASAPGSDLVAAMRITKTASEDYRCAILILQPFARSVDKEYIAFGAETGIQTYKAHINLNDRYLKILRAPDISGGVAGVADELSTLDVERRKLWVDLANLAKLATLGLVDMKYSDSEGHMSGTVLKRSENEEFLKRLLSDFPELKDESQSDKWAAPAQIASFYLKFVTQPYKYVDERPRP